MKKFLKYLLTSVVAFAGMTAFVRAQAFVDFGGGVGSRSHYVGKDQVDRPVYAKGIGAIAKISAGYQFKNIVMEVVEQPSITRKVNSPNYFGGRIGYNIAGSGLIPAAGYYYNLCNSDNPEYNGSFVGYSLKYQVMISDNGGLYAEGMYIKNTYQFTAGFHVQF